MEMAELRVLFIGLDGAGKSTIIANLRNFQNEEVVEIYPTPFFQCHNVKVEQKPVKLIEISGLRRYRKCWKMFYNDVHGIIFVIDSTDIKRMRILNDLIAEVDKDLKRPIPIVFLVNKQDVEKSLTLEDIKNFLDFDKADTNFIWKVEKGSGFKGTGAVEAIKFIRQQVAP